MIRSYIVCRLDAHTDCVVRAYSAEEALARARIAELRYAIACAHAGAVA